MSDYKVGDTIYHHFSTRAFGTGIPTTLAGSPVAEAYEEANATGLTAGVSLTIDHAEAGHHLLTIVATGGNSFETGKSYGVSLTAGTVDSVSVVGEVIFNFTLEKSPAAQDLANGTDGLGALKTLIDGLNDITAANVWAVDATGEQTQGTFGQAVGDPGATAKSLWQATVSDAAGVSVAADVIAVKAETVLIVADTGELQTDDVPGLIATAQADLDTITGAAGALLDSTATSAQLVDDIWDEDVDTSHQTAGTAGKKLDDAGAAADPWATALPGAYGAGTAGKIVGDNVNATISSRMAEASIDTTGGAVDVVTTLTGHTAQTGDSFARIGAAGASLTDLGGMSTGMKAEVEAEVTDALVALGLDPLINTTIATVNSQTDFDLTADSGDDDTYVDGVAVFQDVSTAAQKSFRRILTHTTSPNKNITIDGAPDFTIVATDKIRIFAAGVTPTAAIIADAVWDEATSDHITLGTFGQRLSTLESGTAVAATASTITLDAGSSELADFHNDTLIVITAGTGAGQARFISDYAVTTNVATVNTNWITTPSTDSVYYIIPFGSIPGASAPTAGQVADAVWNEAQADHVAAGSFGITATEIAALQTDLDNGTDGLGALKALIDTVNTDLSNGTDGLGALKTLIDTVNTDLANGTDGLGALKTLIDAVKAETALIVDDTGTAGVVLAGTPAVNVTQLGGGAQSLTDLKDFADAGYDPGTNKVQGVVLVDTVTTLTNHTAQSGDSFARIGADGASLTDLGGMSTGMKAEILVEINAALDAAISELAQAQPSATPSIRTGIMLLYMALRNKLDVQTSGTDALEIHNAAGTLIAKKLLTDAGGDYSEALMVSGA